MSIRLELLDGRDAARIVDALLAQALAEQHRAPMLARRYVEIANRVGDAIDVVQLPAHAPSLDHLDPRFEGPAVGMARGDRAG